jgi:hypothetical protein
MKTTLLTVVVSLLTLGAIVSGAQRVWITVLIDGREVAGFAPRPEPYALGAGPSVCAGVRDAEAKTKDGLPIRAFELIGWKEGDGYRVFAFSVEALCSPGVRRIEFGSIHLGVGQEVLFEEMRAVGATPWSLRVDNRRVRAGEDR